MGRIYKTPFLLRSCTVPGCDLSADFTVKDHKFSPVQFICAKHAFLFKMANMHLDAYHRYLKEQEPEFTIEDGDEVALPGDDADDTERVN
jgi:hypothetical protein